jgi:hypothetical protein
MNRINIAIEKTRERLQSNLEDGSLTTEKANQTHKALDFDWQEYTRFQELKSHAVSMGKITTEEGMTIYNYLGEAGPEKVNNQPLEVKIVLTQLLAKFLS